MNGGPAEIGSHAEIGKTGHQGDDGEEPMEEAMRAPLDPGGAQDGQSRDEHDGTHGPVPVAAAGGNVVVGSHRVGEAIDLERFVAHGAGVELARFDSIAPGIQDGARRELELRRARSLGIEARCRCGAGTV